MINSTNFEEPFFYHTLPEVTSVTSNTGADVGGTFLTLEGLGFDGYKDNTQVFVNDALCENVEVTSTTLVCKTPAEADVGASTGGPRGLKYNLWKGEVVDETAIGAAVDALEKNFGVAMSNMKRALARFRAFFLFSHQLEPFL